MPDSHLTKISGYWVKNDISDVAVVNPLIYFSWPPINFFKNVIPFGAGGAGPLNFVLIGNNAILHTEVGASKLERYACK